MPRAWTARGHLLVCARAWTAPRAAFARGHELVCAQAFARGHELVSIRVLDALLHALLSEMG